MIPYDLDPTLHSTQPHEPLLDDGFSPPVMQEAEPARADYPAGGSPVDPAWWDKSGF